ncbi:GNAT family N-acetyltransferase [Algicola sagamiensis]|uniref:GNAT family N-acetyltransferase n=1 Tax=Algicola sagamiensis TaxID=163869 RepID=UPI000375D2D9|nr:GNAT family N-acetyltransferase [Algicola sagamiensis]
MKNSFQLDINSDNFSEPDIQQLFNSVNWLTQKNQDKVYHAILSSDITVCAWLDQKLVGIACALSDGMKVIVTYLIVHPDAQGQRLSTQLLASLENQVSPGSKLFILTDSAHSTFYEKQGYIQDSKVIFSKKVE